MSKPASDLREILAGHTVPAAEELVLREEGGVVRCQACAHRCRMQPGRHGVCHVRFNENGELRVPSGYVAGLGADPIEKKPFFHVYPGSNALSFGMVGCNFHCPFCQNWITSQTLRDERAVTSVHPVTVEDLLRLASDHQCRMLISTYNEPLITAEWAATIFRAGAAHGLRGSLVSNGHGTPEVLAYLRPHVDFFKIDLKAFDDETYHRLGGVLQHVLDTIRLAREMGYWVEVVTLVVPGLNDSDEELRQIAHFLVDVSPDIPWHVTAFHPMYQLTDPPATPAETLLRAHAIGTGAGLKFVYAGNLPGQLGDTENTRCPRCHELLIERRGFRVLRNRLKDGACFSCGEVIPGAW
ncbi:MAG: AmmeMemoRadiSam system radical SAM enzyme [Phycisphaerae bacterium]|jgi:pyruvate formate lyase activating enzyme